MIWIKISADPVIDRNIYANNHGAYHGAVLFALADTAFAYAANSENRATLAITYGGLACIFLES